MEFLNSEGREGHEDSDGNPKALKKELKVYGIFEVLHYKVKKGKFKWNDEYILKSYESDSEYETDSDWKDQD